MLYLVGDPVNPNSTKYFFANPIKRIVSSHLACDIPTAVSDYKHALANHNGKSHSVLSWINAGSLKHDDFTLVAVFESDDLTQDFKAGITNFRENHPEYFL